jgi:hypothetical protein
MKIMFVFRGGMAAGTGRTSKSKSEKMMPQMTTGWKDWGAGRDACAGEFGEFDRSADFSPQESGTVERVRHRPGRSKFGRSCGINPALHLSWLRHFQSRPDRQAGRNKLEGVTRKLRPIAAMSIMSKWQHPIFERSRRLCQASDWELAGMYQNGCAKRVA